MRFDPLLRIVSGAGLTIVIAVGVWVVAKQNDVSLLTGQAGGAMEVRANSIWGGGWTCSPARFCSTDREVIYKECTPRADFVPNSTVVQYCTCAAIEARCKDPVKGGLCYHYAQAGLNYPVCGCRDDLDCSAGYYCDKSASIGGIGDCIERKGACWTHAYIDAPPWTVPRCTPDFWRSACGAPGADNSAEFYPGKNCVNPKPTQMVCGDGDVQSLAQKKDAHENGDVVHDNIDEVCEPASWKWLGGFDSRYVSNDKGCTSECRRTKGVCGDGTLNEGEQCDDGNTLNGDGCSATCKTEVAGTNNPGAICCFDKCTKALFADNDGDKKMVGTYYPGCLFWGGTAGTIAQAFGLDAGKISSEQVMASEGQASAQCGADINVSPGSIVSGKFYCADLCMERNPPPDADDETLWFAKDCFDECRDVSFEDPIVHQQCLEYLGEPASNKYVGLAGTCGKVLCAFKDSFSCNAGVFTECAKCGDGPQQEEFWESGYCDCTQTDANEGYCYEETVGGASKTVYHIDFQCVDMGDHSSCLLPGSGGYTGGTGGGGLSGTTGGNTGGGTTGTTSGQTSGTTGGTTGGTTAGTTGGTSGGKTTGGTAGTTGGTTSGGGSSASDDTSSAGSTPISSRRSSSQVSKRQESSHPGERGYCCDSDKVCRQREGCTQTFFNCLVECSGISVPSSSSSSDASVSHSSSSSSSSHPSSGSSISRSSATSITSISRSSTPSSGTSSIRVSSVSTERSSASSSRSSESSNSSRRSSSRTSSRSNSSRSFSLGISCLGDECSIGGSQFCSIQNMTCVQTSGLPCIRCVGSTSSIFVSNNCRGDECDLGGDAFCSVQGAACVSTPGFPCIQCIPIIISSAFSSRSITIEVPSFSSRPQIVLEVSCGNGTLDLGEGCDDGNNYPGDGCSPDCEREFCGNGRLDTGESCDNGERNSNNPNAECRTDCTPGRCGDNIQDTPLELCDDGNTTNGDGCDASCQLERTGPNTLPAQIIELPFQLPSSTSYTTTYVPPSTPEPPTNTDTGPAALLVMISGAAAGYAWMKRRVGK